MYCSCIGLEFRRPHIRRRINHPWPQVQETIHLLQISGHLNSTDIFLNTHFSLKLIHLFFFYYIICTHMLVIPHLWRSENSLTIGVWRPNSLVVRLGVKNFYPGQDSRAKSQLCLCPSTDIWQNHSGISFSWIFSHINETFLRITMKITWAN